MNWRLRFLTLSQQLCYLILVEVWKGGKTGHVGEDLLSQDLMTILSCLGNEMAGYSSTVMSNLQKISSRSYLCLALS